MGKTLIEVRHLSKSYGPVRALEDVSFEIPEGEVAGFLGPNGAGKTTTLRILAGFLPGDRGVVRVAGHDVRRESLTVRRIIGYLPEGVPLYPELRVVEYLRFRARLKGIPLRQRGQQIDKSLEAAGVKDVRRRIIGTLSRGYRQRVGLADALLNEPRVLILDEPTVGLDPEQIRQFRALLREVGSQRTVLLSTHILREVELVCSSVVIISGGRIVAQARSDELLARVGDRCVSAEIAGPRSRIEKALRKLPGVTRVVARDRGTDSPGEGRNYHAFSIQGGGKADIREHVFGLVERENWKLRHLQREDLSLEEVFLDVVGGGA